jgi:hypothetical protein
MAEGNKQKTGVLRPITRTRKGSSNSHSNSKLHQREVMLIRRLWFEGWTDYQIWKEYRIPFPVIQKAKRAIERQSTEEFENKEMYAVELAMLKDRLKFVVDSMDSITKDPNVSLVDRINSERIKLEALAILRDTIEASISYSDPHSALESIVERNTADHDNIRVAAANRK